MKRLMMGIKVTIAVCWVGLLGFLKQTSMDAAVFIGALQRRLHKPTVGDVLSLNRVVN